MMKQLSLMLHKILANLEQKGISLIFMKCYV